MARASDGTARARRREGLRLLQSGVTVKEVAEKLGVRPETVGKWVREDRARGARGAERGARKRSLRTVSKGRARGAPSGASITAMLKAEAPHIARVLLDMAKGGDMRAAALVMKLIGDHIGSTEDINGRDPEADERELERELKSIPPAIASEIVALLAKAEAEIQGPPGDEGETVDGPGRRPRRLPWVPEGDPSPEGRDAV